MAVGSLMSSLSFCNKLPANNTAGMFFLLGVIIAMTSKNNLVSLEVTFRMKYDLVQSGLRDNTIGCKDANTTELKGAIPVVSLILCLCKGSLEAIILRTQQPRDHVCCRSWWHRVLWYPMHI